MPDTAEGSSCGMPQKAAASRSETERCGRVKIAPMAPSLGLDLAGARDRRPVRDLLGDVLPELRRGHRHHGERLGLEALTHVVGSDQLVYFHVELADDRVGQLRRADDAVPGER